MGIDDIPQGIEKLNFQYLCFYKVLYDPARVETIEEAMQQKEHMHEYLRNFVLHATNFYDHY